LWNSAFGWGTRPLSPTSPGHRPGFNFAREDRGMAQAPSPTLFLATTHACAEGIRKAARAAHAVAVTRDAPLPTWLRDLARSTAYGLARLPRPVVQSADALAAQAGTVEGGSVMLDAGAAAVLALAAAGLAVLATRLVRRYPTAGSLPERAFSRNRVIRGRVVGVADGDNLRIYHQPPLLRWLTSGWTPDLTRKLGATTVHIRLAGIDAPEAPHFGRPGQPYAEEARAWLEAYALGKAVKVKLLKRDQYGRAVASVKVDRLSRASPVPLPALFPFAWWSDVSMALVDAGFADVYTSGGAEHDGQLEALESARDTARKRKRGMWRLGAAYVSPMEFKAKHNAAG
ncbi:uncharacterized protein AMSG_02630, partial [Thecamonas trahens ATCC 50062]